MIKLADTLTPMSNDFYAVESENVGINIDGTSKSIQQAYEDGDLSGSGSAIQVDLLPPPSVDELGKIYEFIGSTGTYVNGYFYECVSDEQNPPTYSWVQKNVQPNAESFTFNEDDFNTDSSTDKVSLLPSRRVFNGTKAAWGLLSVEEKTQYGATAFTDDEGGGSNLDIYSTSEVKTNKVWLDDKPLYRKCFTGITSSGKYTADFSNVDTFVRVYGYIKLPDSTLQIIPTYISSSNYAQIYDLNSSGFQLGINGWSSFNGTVILEYTKTTD